MMENRPGAILFTRSFSLERKHTVGKQITVEELIEKHIVIMIFKAMIMNIGIMPVTSKPTPTCIYYY